MTAPRPRWSAVTIDCADPLSLARFWAALLGGELSVPLPGWQRLHPADSALPHLNFQPVAEPKIGKTRIHLDVVVDDIASGIERVTVLGGRRSGERHEYAEGVVEVLVDPEGNEFCLTQYFDGR